MFLPQKLVSAILCFTPWINSAFLGSMFSTNELLLFIFKLKLEILWQIFVI